MNRLVLLTISILFLITRTLSQSNESQSDTAFAMVEVKKEIPATRVHVTIGYGSFLELSGNTFDVYGACYSQGINDNIFTGYPAQINTKNRISFGADLSLNKHISVGLFILPTQRRSFIGGSGVNASNQGGFFGLIGPSSYMFQGVYVVKNIESFNYALRGNYTIIPFKTSRKEGLQVTTSVGVFLNNTQVSTTLYAYDTVMVGSLVQVHHEKESSVEHKKGVGALFNLRLDLRAVSLFSIYGEFATGIGPRYSFSQRSLTFMSQTAEAPAHTEKLTGFGLTVGLTFHVMEMKDKKK